MHTLSSGIAHATHHAAQDAPIGGWCWRREFLLPARADGGTGAVGRSRGRSELCCAVARTTDQRHAFGSDNIPRAAVACTRAAGTGVTRRIRGAPS